MRILFLAAVALAALADPWSTAQAAVCWRTTAPGGVWYTATPVVSVGPVVYGRVVMTTPVYRSPVVYSSATAYPVYYPAPQPTYSPPAVSGSTSYVSSSEPHRHSAYDMDPEDRYDPAEPGGPNH
jgi:hypothetical protein